MNIPPAPQPMPLVRQRRFRPALDYYWIDNEGTYGIIGSDARVGNNYFPMYVGTPPKDGRTYTWNTFQHLWTQVGGKKKLKTRKARKNRVNHRK
jgi:hypothetical protein